MSGPDDDPAADVCDAPVSIDHGAHRTWLKWHRARRRAGDTAFTAERIIEGMRAGASVEVDLVIHADRGFAVLHDAEVDRATTGVGRVGELGAATLRTLYLRDARGEPTDSRVLVLDDLAEILDGIDIAPKALLQLDFKDTAADLDVAALDSFEQAVRPIADHAILSCGDAEAVAALTARVPDIHIGYDPCHGGAIDRVVGSGDFDGFVAEAVLAAPGAEMIYLDHGLVLHAADRGHDLIGAFHDVERRVDAYTIHRADERTLPMIERLIALRADQITTDDAEGLVAAWSAEFS
ncbi:glycerophosphodiester phosphodiesterase [Gordonia soli]|uniref:GP-PDE domain-containing protein n=1 Tax=Gordonia soli NBRC 108243 TaxID=1223545 RepID=M0QM16_9ACTN|nr:glycerophosphodiester phosphodiesterase family protein [Gordonia soli]GAC68427.1 hypothetical protein GS4_15_00770 [Gordonia soli NBRC 108243]